MDDFVRANLATVMFAVGNRTSPIIIKKMEAEMLIFMLRVWVILSSRISHSQHKKTHNIILLLLHDT
jgi:hypothetical protein